VVQIRANEDWIHQVEAMARRAGMSVSGSIRFAVNRAMADLDSKLPQEGVQEQQPSTQQG
jgi:hypothetical protein